MTRLCTHYACRCARAAELAAWSDRTGEVRFLLDALRVFEVAVPCRVADEELGSEASS
jgi:hypothetical protein